MNIPCKQLKALIPDYKTLSISSIITKLQKKGIKASTKLTIEQLITAIKG